MENRVESERKYHQIEQTEKKIVGRNISAVQNGTFYDLLEKH